MEEQPWKLVKRIGWTDWALSVASLRYSAPVSRSTQSSRTWRTLITCRIRKRSEEEEEDDDEEEEKEKEEEETKPIDRWLIIHVTRQLETVYSHYFALRPEIGNNVDGGSAVSARRCFMNETGVSFIHFSVHKQISTVEGLFLRTSSVVLGFLNEPT